ncbi:MULTISPECIES: hypothetical protein [Mesonia]|uniref:Uncharacterized protein n=1 Tax=Mesonia oceanica TaxID=2687242 RepID=A0AC61Y5Q4_9FLAO|nr:MULTISPECIES: hypothetical protein [Mesonia]VVU98759.1 hypothetical protein FVB9532_00005 [Mesonia oceanica]
MSLDLVYIESQLKQRLPYPYQWGKKQTDKWDNYTNFIYDFPSWEAVVEAMKATTEAYGLNKRELFNYAANRWFNFWSAMAVEQIFTEIDGVTPSLNHKDRLVDFNLRGIDFDHKTSVFPEAYKQTLYYAQHHHEDLLYWLYKNQSQQQRKHLENRLFIVTYAEDGEHWKLKAEISLLKQCIQKYVSTFDASTLEQLQLNNKTIYSDIIWAVK